MSATDSPTIPEAGPPWELTGRGWVLLSRFDPDFYTACAQLPPELAERASGDLGLTMFVDYASSDVGPYKELLCAPRRLRCADRRTHWSISSIFVDSEASAVNGRRNWGIPKELASFELEGDEETERIRVLKDGSTVADLTFTSGWPKLHVSTLMLPRPWYRFGQELDGQTFIFAPRARGRVKRGRLVSAEVDDALFPDIARGKQVTCMEVTTFKMRFPIPRVLDRVWSA